MPKGTGRIESRWLVVDDMRLHARVSVDDPPATNQLPVVLVHGLSVSSRYMLPTARHLAPEYRVYAPDLPGFGKSFKPHRVLSIPELADTLQAYMATAGIPRAAMIANSLGCQIVAEFALRYPEALDRAVLIGPTMDRSARTIHQQAWRLLLDTPCEPLSQPFVVGWDYLKTGLRRTLGTLRYALADRIEEKLVRIQMPMLVVRGANDPIVSQAWSEEVARLLPDGALVVVPNAAHTVNYSEPATLLRIVRPFFSRQAAPVGDPAGERRR